MKKKIARLRRASRSRYRIRSLEINRLSIHRTSKHIYAQIFSVDGLKTLAHASTLDVVFKNQMMSTSNIHAASIVGKLIAERAIKNGIFTVAFDRSGFKYHGRVQALAIAARENGLKF
jgi:large subunit ribosomal protein L18